MDERDFTGKIRAIQPSCKIKTFLGLDFAAYAPDIVPVCSLNQHPPHVLRKHFQK